MSFDFSNFVPAYPGNTSILLQGSLSLNASRESITLHSRYWWSETIMHHELWLSLTQYAHADTIPHEKIMLLYVQLVKWKNRTLAVLSLSQFWDKIFHVKDTSAQVIEGQSRDADLNPHYQSRRHAMNSPSSQLRPPLKHEHHLTDILLVACSIWLL